VGAASHRTKSRTNSLNPDAATANFNKLPIYRSRIPMNLLKNIVKDVQKAEIQYGNLTEHDNEKARSRFLAALFGPIICLFKTYITKNPVQLLYGITSKGQIEHQYVALGSIIVVFVQVKKEMASGKNLNGQIAQVMARTSSFSNTVRTQEFGRSRRGLQVFLLLRMIHRSLWHQSRRVHQPRFMSIHFWLTVYSLRDFL